MTADRLIARLLVIPLLVMAIATPLRAQEPEDPYLWLEEVSGEKPLEWVRARNAESTGELAESAEFRNLEHRILSILDSDAKIPFIQKLGPYYYNFWRDGKHPRGLWRRTSLEEYRKKNSAWETVIDVDALCASENEKWVWHGAQVLKPDYRRCIVALSRGGSDADVKREFDLTTKAFISDGFKLPEAKSRISWRGPDSLFVGTDFGPGTLTSSGYPRIVKEWNRNTPLPQAATVFEAKPEDMSATALPRPDSGVRAATS